MGVRWWLFEGGHSHMHTNANRFEVRADSLTERRYRARIARNTELRDQIARERSRVVAQGLPSPTEARRHQLLQAYLNSIVSRRFI